MDRQRRFLQIAALALFPGCLMLLRLRLRLPLRLQLLLRLLRRQRVEMLQLPGKFDQESAAVVEKAALEAALFGKPRWLRVGRPGC